MRNAERKVRHWFMAKCGHCEMTLPFSKEEDREGWASTHGQVQHEYRADPASDPYPQIEFWEETR